MTLMRSVQTKGFEALLPIYQECQCAYDKALEDRKLLQKILNLPETMEKNGEIRKCLMGDYFKMLREDMKKYTPENVPNPSWYLRMIEYNLICLRDSLKERLAIYECLKAHRFDPFSPQVREELASKGIFASSSYLQNLARTRRCPDFPEHAAFRMDYAYSDRQMCRFDGESLELSIMTIPKKTADSLGVEAWTEFKLYLPPYIREQAAGKICKPLFFMNRDGNLVCQIAYECRPETHEGFQNVLGVDLGKVKPYSATVLYPDNTCSDEYIPSRELDRLSTKLDSLQAQIDANYEKSTRCKAYGIPDENPKQQARLENYSLARQKRTRIKEKAQWLIAEETVQIAVENQCREIHLEQLNWINNQGGKWDYSMTQKRIEEVAQLHGIAVVYVSCKNSSTNHPETGESGRQSGRNILFKDGTSVDRDQLAGLNLALRSKKETRTAKLKPRQTRKTRRSASRRRQCRQRKAETFRQAAKRYDKEKRTGKIALFSSMKAGFPALAVVQSSLCQDSRYADHNILPRQYLGRYKTSAVHM